MIGLALAALFGGLLGAPVAVLSWERRLRILAHVRWNLRKIRRRVRSLYRRWIVGAIARKDTGRHATPRDGTPVITPAQIKEAAARC